MTPPPGYRAVLWEIMDQPPAVNESAIRGVPGACRMLAGAENEKTRSEAGSFDMAVVICQPVGIEIPSLRVNLAIFIQ